ncbi:MAG: LysR family transcriptional regulator [Firmicutes bacterium]|nr:LysR family transcriptional regulator [Bacillota bacterium]
MRNLDYLKAFIAVVEEGSFQRAADTLHVAQPTVSFRLQALERELDAKLLHRSNHKNELTEIGRYLYQVGKEILALDSQINKFIESRRKSDLNHVILASGSTIGVYIMPQVIALFQKMHPQAQLELQICNTEQSLQKLLANVVDIAILGSQIRHQDLEIFKLLEYEASLIVPSAHPLVKIGKVKIADLLAYPLIMRERGSLTRKAFEEALRKQGFSLRDFKVIMELNSTEAIKVAIESGLGLSFICPWAVKAQLISGILKVVKVEDLNIKREIFVAVNKRGFLTQLGEQLLRFLHSRELNFNYSFPP